MRVTKELPVDPRKEIVIRMEEDEAGFLLDFLGTIKGHGSLTISNLFLGLKGALKDDPPAPR